MPSQDVLRAEAALNAAILTAPFDGVVLDVRALPGDYVGPGTGIMLFADPSAVEVRATVVEEDLPLVAIGQSTEVFFDAQPDAIVEGTVARVVPRRVPEQNRPLFYVFISPTEIPHGIVAGMTADASIIIDKRDGVLRLPRAVVRGPANATSRVTVWANGREEQRSVQIGLRGDVNVEIVDGLAENERVVAE